MRAVHARPAIGGSTPCGKSRFYVVTSEAAAYVTCKLCLRALTAHDRAFQRKARAQLTRKGPLIVRRGRAFEAADALGEAAVVAILVEEGHNERAARIAASFGVTR